MKLSDQITRRHLFVAFGTSSQTGSLSSVDLAATRDDASVALTASDGSVAPIAGADAFAAGVMTAADKTRLDNLPPTMTRDFGILSEVPGVTVRAAITRLRTAGRFAPGDGRGALYRRATAEPSHAFRIQSGDGAWWEGVPDVGRVNVHQFSAVQARVSFASALTCSRRRPPGCPKNRDHLSNRHVMYGMYKSIC